MKNKKIKIFALVLVVCLLFLSGCGKNLNIKLCATNMSASDFFHASMLEIVDTTDKILQELTNGSDEMEDYREIDGIINAPGIFYYNLICSMDFCLAIKEETIPSDETLKIYEFDAGGISIVVLVSKKVGKSVYTASQHIVSRFEGLDDLTDFSLIQENVFTISETGGIYNYSDTKSSIAGRFDFNKLAGKMNFTMEYKSEDGKFTVNNTFYHYVNGVLGGRQLVDYELEGTKTNYIMEYLCSDFNKALKMGTIKDHRLYVDMEASESNRIGVSNSGDNYGFAAIIDASGTDVVTTTKTYGLFPA